MRQLADGGMTAKIGEDNSPDDLTAGHRLPGQIENDTAGERAQRVSPAPET
jgi:hypothetical protein